MCAAGDRIQIEGRGRVLGVDPADADRSEPHDVVAALVVQDGRVLLCHRSAVRRWYPDVWDLPGGHVEAGEAPIEALARELEEEVGISIEKLGPESPRVIGAGFAMRIWHIERWVGDPVNVSPEEHDDVGWFTLSEAAELRLAHDDYLRLIRRTLSGLVAET